MDILKGKPAGFAAVLCSFICIISVYTEAFFVYIIAAAAVLGAAVVAVLIYKSQKITGYRLFSVISVFVITLAIIFRCGIYCTQRNISAEKLTGEDRRVTGTVTELRYAGSYYTQYIADITSVDGIVCDTSALLTCDYVCDLKSGYSFEITGTVITMNEDSTLIADGVVLCIESDDYTAVSVTKLPDNSLQNMLSDFKNSLVQKLELTVDGEEGKLAAGILLGAKDLSASVKRDCRRSGVSHLLAVSGMHLSVISAFAEYIFKKIGIGKRFRMFIIGVIMLAYLIMLGFPASAMRSVIMLLITYIGYWSGIGSDSISSLSIAVVIILMFSPSSVCDAGFILTVCATLGITSVMGEYNKFQFRKRRRKEGLISLFNSGVKEARKRRLYEFCCRCSDRVFTAVVASLSVNMLTVLPTAAFFGEISLMTFPSNIILPPLASAIMILSLFTLIFYPVPVLSGMFGYYTSLVAGVFIKTVSAVSSIRNVTFSLRFSFVPYILIPATCITVLLLIIRLRRKFFVCVPVLISALLICLCSSTVLYSGKLDTYFVTGTSGEGIAVGGGNTAIICDISSGSSKILTSAYEQAMRTGATEVEAVILTHYHQRHISALTTFVSKYKTRAVWMPCPEDSSDCSVFYKIYGICEEEGINCYIYDSFEELTVFGDAVFTCSGPERITRSTHPVLLVNLICGSTDITYVGKSAWEGAACSRFLSEKSLQISVLGTHGPVAKNIADIPVYGNVSTVYRDEELLYYTVPIDKEKLEAMKKGNVTVNTGVLYIALRE